MVDKFIKAYHKNECLFDFRYGDMDGPNGHTLKGETDIPDKSLIIYVNDSKLSELLSKLYFKRHKYVLLVETGDRSLNPVGYLPYNVHRIYSCSIDTWHPLYSYFPFGILQQQFNGISRSEKIVTRDNKLFVAFNLQTYEHRERYLKNIKELPADFIACHYPWNLNEFYDRLWTHKYTACPRGNAIDTYRKYEALHSGSIPVVQPNITNQRSIFPCIFTDMDFNITVESIEKQLSQLKYIDNTTLHCEFWRKKMENDLT